MTTDATAFQKVPIQPVQCFKDGWELIKDQYWLFLGITALGMLLAGAVPLVIQGAMMCGIYLCYFDKLRGERAIFDRLFKGFDYFVQSLLVTLFLVLITLPFTGAFMVFYIVIMIQAVQEGQQPDPTQLLIAYLWLLPVLIALSILIGVFFMFAYMLIVDRGLKAGEAIKTSFRAGWANFGGLLGLFLIGGLLGIVGMLCCYVGSFFIMPISFGAMVIAYRKVFPEMETEESQSSAEPAEETQVP